MTMKPTLATLCLFALLSVTPRVGAQTTEGTITGAITDPAGASVKGVEVSIQNESTKETRLVTTDSIGFFRADYLKPGTYDVQVTVDGFRPELRTGVGVAPSTITRADVHLSLGQLAEAVNVTGDPTEVHTEDSRVISTLSAQQTRDLPTNGREVYQLALLSPGVTQTQAPVISNSEFGTFNYGFSANGASPRGNNFVLDGISNNNEWLGGTPAVSPSIEAIQDFQVQTLNFSPEFGRNNGSVISVVTRSGGNAFHGVVYDYVQNPVFDAHNYFDTATSQTSLKQNDFGANLSGPIVRDRSFFFFNYEGMRSVDSASLVTQGETPQFRAQVALYRPNSIANTQFKNFPSPACTPGTSVDTGSIFMPNATIADIKQIPFSDFASGAADGIPDVCQVVYQSKRSPVGNQYAGRYDQVLNSKDRLFVRGLYGSNTTDEGRETLFAAESRGFKAPFSASSPSGAIGETHVFNERALNDVRFAYTRENFSIGFRAPALNSSSYPTLVLDDGSAQFGGAELIPRQFIFNQFTANDTFALTLGRHSLKTGFEVRRIQENSNYELYTEGYYEFDNVFTMANDNPYVALGLVNPVTGLFTGSPRHFRWTQYGAFVQDDWKVTPKLSVNLGVRYDLFVTPTETNGLLGNVILGTGTTFDQQYANATVGQVSKMYATNKNNVSPRLGFSYDPSGTGRMAIRSSFAIAYLEPYSNLFSDAARFNPPYAAIETVFPDYYGGSINYQIPAAPSPGFETGATGSNSTGIRPSPWGMDSNLKTAYSEQWFLGFDTKVLGSQVLTINYVGTSGHKLYSRDDPNRFTGDRPNLATGARRLNTNWASVLSVANEGHSIYHGVSATLQKPMSHGVMYTLNYTLSKALDNESDAGETDYANVSSTADGFMDTAKPNLDYGRGDFDARHRFTANAIWSLPSVHFKRDVDYFVNGWQLNSIVTLQSGRPFSVFCGTATTCDYNGDGDDSDRPNVPTFGSHLHGLSRSNYVKGLFSTSAFPTPTYGTNGNLGRNTYTGPGLATVDASVFKTFAIHEAVKLQFRAEAFNLFNRVNLYLPKSNLSQPFFGQSTQAFAARQMQLALKLSF